MCVVPHVPATGHPRLRAVLVRAGDGCYSTCLTHTFLLGAGAGVLTTAHLSGNDIVFALTEAVGCTIAGVEIYRLVERPVLGRLTARFGHPRESSGAAGAM